MTPIGTSARQRHPEEAGWEKKKRAADLLLMIQHLGPPVIGPSVIQLFEHTDTKHVTTTEKAKITEG